MFRRVVDLTTVSNPSIASHTTVPPLFGLWEDDGPDDFALVKLAYKSKCIVEAFCLDTASHELFFNIILGHNTPHTHVDIFMHDWDTMLGQLPPSLEHTKRDVSLVPAAHIVGEASVVDISDIDAKEIDLPTFKQRAKHVRENDILIAKTGHARRRREQGEDAILPLISKDVAEWLTTEKRIRVWADDMRRVGSASKGDWFAVEQVLYRSLVTMVDELQDLEDVSAGRYYADCGIVLRLGGSEDSPSRAKLFSADGDLTADSVVPIFDPINLYRRSLEVPPKRTEPGEIIEEIMKRYWVKGFHCSMKPFGMDRIGWAPYKSFTNRLGTHIQIPFDVFGDKSVENWNLAGMDEKKLSGRAAIVDMPTVGCEQNVDVQDLERFGKHIEQGDIVLVRTNFTDNYYHRGDFMRYSPGFSKKAISWLMDKQIKMLVTDSATVEQAGKGRNEMPIEARRRLWGEGVPCVTCATNLWMLEKEDYVFLSVSPLAIEGINASPARVVAIEEYA